jgi:hypothetical protein
MRFNTTMASSFAGFRIPAQRLFYPDPMREKPMRLIALATAAALLMIPAASSTTQATEITDISAAKKKAKAKAKKEKVEYMRAVPSR